jgi:hypothetical protein
MSPSSEFKIFDVGSFRALVVCIAQSLYIQNDELLQVSTWFANARRRLKKENKMQWSPRQRTGDDDDDDVDEDDSPNDVTNGSFSVSDDECSNDIIVDDRGNLI